MKKHRYSNEFKVTAVKMATAPDIETKAVAGMLEDLLGAADAVYWWRDGGHRVI